MPVSTVIPSCCHARIHVTFSTQHQEPSSTCPRLQRRLTPAGRALLRKQEGCTAPLLLLPLRGGSPAKQITFLQSASETHGLDRMCIPRRLVRFSNDAVSGFVAKFRHLRKCGQRARVHLWRLERHWVKCDHVHTSGTCLVGVLSEQHQLAAGMTVHRCYHPRTFKRCASLHHILKR